MRDLPIAYGNSCYAKTWSNKTTKWENLCERLRNTTRTTETVEEYPKMKKDDRDRAKERAVLSVGISGTTAASVRTLPAAPC